MHLKPGSRTHYLKMMLLTDKNKEMLRLLARCRLLLQAMTEKISVVCYSFQRQRNERSAESLYD